MSAACCDVKLSQRVGRHSMYNTIAWYLLLHKTTVPDYSIIIKWPLLTIVTTFGRCPRYCMGPVVDVRSAGQPAAAADITGMLGAVIRPQMCDRGESLQTTWGSRPALIRLNRLVSALCVCVCGNHPNRAVASAAV